MQKEWYKGLTGLGREKPCKKNGGKWQKIILEPWPSRIEREKVEKTFEKVSLNRWKSVFKKFSTWFSIYRKTNLIGRKCFDWSNTNRAPIEIDRDSQTFLIAILIGRKTSSISRKSGKIRFLKNKAKTPQSIEFYESHAWV